MIDNTDAQAELHPDLIGEEAARVINLARAHGALGWKVNGAGGAGGSLTLLCGARSEAKRALLREIAQEDASFQIIPIRLSRGGLRGMENRGHRARRTVDLSVMGLAPHPPQRSGRPQSRPRRAG